MLVFRKNPPNFRSVTLHHLAHLLADLLQQQPVFDRLQHSIVCLQDDRKRLSSQTWKKAPIHQDLDLKNSQVQFLILNSFNIKIMSFLQSKYLVYSLYKSNFCDVSLFFFKFRIYNMSLWPCIYSQKPSKTRILNMCLLYLPVKTVFFQQLYSLRQTQNLSNHSC